MKLWQILAAVVAVAVALVGSAEVKEIVKDFKTVDHNDTILVLQEIPITEYYKDLNTIPDTYDDDINEIASDRKPPATDGSPEDPYRFKIPGADSPNSIVHAAASRPTYGSGSRESRVIQVAVLQPDDAYTPRRGRRLQRRGKGRSRRAARDGPLTLADSAAIVSPDTFEQIKRVGVAFDSYGNPVTPFSDLLLETTPATKRPPRVLLDKGYRVDENGFLIPSYASGVLEVKHGVPPPGRNSLLSLPSSPPLSSGNYFFPGLEISTSTEVIRLDETTTEPPKSVPAIRGDEALDSYGQIPDSQTRPTGFDLPVELLPPLEDSQFGAEGFTQENTPLEPPSIELLPPLPDGVRNELDTPKSQEEAVKTEPVPEPVKKPDNYLLPPFPSPQAIPTEKAPSLSQGRPIPPPIPASPSPIPPLPAKIPVAPHQAPVSPSIPASPSPAVLSSPAVPAISPVVPPQAPSVPFIPPQVPNRGSFVPPPVPLPAVFPTAAPNKYTGSFGGPPGILTPFEKPEDKPGFAVNPRPGQALPPIAAPPPPLPAVQVQPQATPRPVVVAPPKKNKYTGSFGGPPGLLTPYDNLKSLEGVSAASRFSG